MNSGRNLGMKRIDMGLALCTGSPMDPDLYMSHGVRGGLRHRLKVTLGLWLG